MNSGNGYNRTYFYLKSDDTLTFNDYGAASTNGMFNTTQVFRDPSAWMHIVLVFDTSNATAGDRIRIYVNGVRVTTFSAQTNPSLNFTGAVNTASQHIIGDEGYSPQLYDGLMAETFFIDGQALTPSSFGETDPVTGVWKPKKYAGTYGTNGFYLNFSDPSAATAAAIGKDSSGNGNNWTPNNISVTAGVTYDSMIDVPTMGGASSNYCVLNPLTKGANIGITNGNLDALGTVNTNSVNCVQGSIAVSSGKWYAEFKVTNTYSYSYLGVVDPAAPGTYPGQLSSGYGLEVGTGATYNVSAGPTITGASAGDTIMVALDMDSGKLWWGKNGTWGGSGDPSAGTGQQYSSLSGLKTFGLSAYSSSGTFNANFGQRPFAYTPPTGFKALNTQNLPDATIKKGNQYFDSSLWTGNGTSQSIVNSGAMQPDLVWAKQRSSTQWHRLIDAVRGSDKVLYSNDTSAEFTDNTQLTSFNSNGFSVGSQSGVNASAATYVGWQWKESVSAGFDIVTGTTPASGNFTVAHSLGVVPSMFIFKRRNTISSWGVWHKNLAGGSSYLLLEGTAAQVSDSTVWTAAPSSSVLNLGTAWNAAGAQTFVAYCFAEVAGYSKFGSYTGNGSADGPFVYTGFRPRFVMFKRSSNIGNWHIWDTARNTYNVLGEELYPNLSNAGYTDVYLDILSNGFKIRNGATGEVNASGDTYVYACFAENPFKNSLAR